MSLLWHTKYNAWVTFFIILKYVRIFLYNFNVHLFVPVVRQLVCSQVCSPFCRGLYAKEGYMFYVIKKKIPFSSSLVIAVICFLQSTTYQNTIKVLLLLKETDWVKFVNNLVQAEQRKPFLKQDLTSGLTRSTTRATCNRATCFY